MSNARHQSVAKEVATVPALIPSHYWIIGPKEDLLLFLGTPVLLLTLVAIAQTFWNLTALSVFATVLAMGHYLPGLMRAYGDPALFNRFKTRFLLAPIVLIGTTLAVSRSEYESNVFFMVVVIWGAWHWLMQTYGLVRIYDAKAKNFDTKSARLDYALCISWFGVIYWYTDGASPILVRFYKAGGALAPDFIRVFAWLWLAATVLITAFYFAHAIKRWKSGNPPSYLKLALLFVTGLFYLYAFGFSSSKIVAFMLFEGYHDIQYLAIVWIFNRNRASKDQNAGAFTRYLFRQRSWLVVLYVALCIGFGSYDYVARNLITETEVAKMAVALITGFALVHFYFDGFIWRIREPETRATLGVDGESKAPKLRVPPQLRHAFLWVLLLTPLLTLAYRERETRAETSATSVLLNVIKANPLSHKTHYELSKEYLDAGNLELALKHAQASRDLRPGFDLYESRYADILLARGNLNNDELDRVIESYQVASATRPDVADMYRNWALALTQRGLFDDAQQKYELAVELDPSDADSYVGSAGIFVRQNRIDDAIRMCHKAIQVNPDLAGAHSLLGACLMSRNRPDLAFGHFRSSLKIKPDQVQVLTDFSQALAFVNDPGLRNIDEAMHLAERAKDLTKGQNPTVLGSLARIYAAAGRKDEAKSIAQKAAKIFTEIGQQALGQRLLDAISL